MYSGLIGSEMRAIRSRKGLSLKDVEEKTGIYAQRISDYENNKTKIKIGTLEKILNEAYEINLYIFFKSIL